MGLAFVGAVIAALTVWMETGENKVQGTIDSLAVQPIKAEPAPPPEAVQRPSPAVPAGRGLGQQIRELVESHEPAKLYAAYLYLAGCADNGEETLVRDENKSKDTLTHGPFAGYRHLTKEEKQKRIDGCQGIDERDRRARLDYLAVAAKAGLRGAPIMFALQGPFGDPSALKTRPNDPLVREWKELAKAQLISAAEYGNDLGALTYVSRESRFGSDLFEKNLRLTYRYSIALGIIQREIQGPNAEFPKLFAEDSEHMAALAENFSPAEKAAELEAAKLVAKKYHDLRLKTGQDPSN